MLTSSCLCKVGTFVENNFFPDQWCQCLCAQSAGLACIERPPRLLGFVYLRADRRGDERCQHRSRPPQEPPAASSQITSALSNMYRNFILDTSWPRLHQGCIIVLPGAAEMQQLAALQHCSTAAVTHTTARQICKSSKNFLQTCCDFAHTEHSRQ